MKKRKKEINYDIFRMSKHCVVNRWLKILNAGNFANVFEADTLTNKSVLHAPAPHSKPQA